VNEHVHIYAEHGYSGRGRFAYWRECRCGDVIDYHERPSPYLVPRRWPRRLSWPMRLWLLLTAGILACFAWVALFDDHRSDLECGPDSRTQIGHCVTVNTYPNVTPVT
jgi:hypothetical protein